VTEILLRHVGRPAGVSRSTWRPFEPTLGFNDAWWSRVPYATSAPHFVTFSVGSTEIGRVELDHNWSGSLHMNAPRLGAEALEIQLIEIAQDHRREGLGAAVVRRLAEEFPERRLLALSEEADSFWSSLGWDRYDYGTPPHHYRPLFIEPAAPIRH
jgi:GNAT superfamily N-acetyltransferase